ncbi:sulfonate ABC transporter substrate-binding protein [Undibacterium terreum]
MKKWITALLLAAPLLAQGASPTAITIGYQKSSGLLAILKNQGTLEKAFAAQSLQIKWIEFPAGPQILEALNAGSIDFGSTGAPPPVFAQAAGIDLLYVGAEPAPVNSEAIFVPKDSALRAVADLKGKRIAFQKGSGSHFLLASALQKAGLKLGDIVPIYLSPSEARAAFVSGNIDAWVVWDPYFASAQKSYQVRVLSDYQGLPQANGFYLASRRFAEQSPKTVAALLEQVALTGQWANQHQHEVSAMLAPTMGLPIEIVETWQRRTRYGAIPVSTDIAANQQRVADLFYEQKLIPKAVSVAGKVWVWQRGGGR